MYLNTIIKVVRAFAKNKGIRIPARKLRNDVEDIIAFEIIFKNVIIHLNIMQKTLHIYNIMYNIKTVNTFTHISASTFA